MIKFCKNMKKFNVLIIALLCVCVLSCKDDEKETTGPVITLNTPASDAATVDLNTEAAINFTWQTTGAVAGGYTLYLSNAQTLANALTYTVASGTSKSVTADELNAKLTEWGVAVNTETTIWWTVKATTAGQATAAEPRALKVKSKPEAEAPLAITGPTAKVVLLEANETATAATFSWNAKDGVSYSFIIDIANNSFATATTIETITGSTKSFTVEELNDLIVTKWSKTPGTDVELEVQIIASEGNKIATTKFTAVAYAVAPKSLYLTGTAVPGGAPIELTETDNGIFHWQGLLNAGGFKFLYNYGNDLPSLNKGANNSTLVERTAANQPDDLFPASEAGFYVIDVDRKNLTITYEQIPNYYPNIYPVGDATAADCGGWCLGSLVIPWKADNSGVYFYEGPLKAGEMKFHVNGVEWDSKAFRPLEENGSISKTEVVCTNEFSSGPDYKWRVKESEAGNYRITINIIEMKIYFVKL
jgi:hypothetical protein